MQIVFWLDLAEPDRSYYQGIIDQLAETYDDAPKFAPHVTLYVDQYDPTTDIRAWLESVTQRISPINLVIDGVEFSDLFTKTLFIQFQPDAMLNQLFEAVRQYSGQPSGYVLNPHLSLIYSRSITNTQKYDLVSKIKWRSRMVRFDQVSVLIASDKVESREDIESAEVTHTKKLI
jgi:hypothetical protein